MSKEGKGKIVATSKARTRFVSIPADVAGDDRFPFDDGEEVRVTIVTEKQSIIIEKIK